MNLSSIQCSLCYYFEFQEPEGAYLVFESTKVSNDWF